ncbi:uncharacterized protein [Montipora capricornis]|uniref:uncharacterized protein n=1 Tax=Montipora foliosa TaxID=591990 RepID=UPI0035F0FC83
MRLNEKCVAEYSTSSAHTDKEGHLNKKGELNRGYQRRWFILKGNLLYYFEKRSDKEPIGVIVLDNCHVELAESGEPYAFQITFGGDGRNYILGADTPEEMEAWMRSITLSSYDYLRMMVESFESTLERLTSDENDLASASSIVDPNANSNSVCGIEDRDSRDANSAATETTYPKAVENFVAEDNANLDHLFLPLPVEEAVMMRNVDNDIAFPETDPATADLISFHDESDDDQMPIPSEFRLDEALYSFSKHTTDIMPLSFSELEPLEHMPAENLLSRLSAPVRSRDDSELNLTVKRDPLPRSQRPKSERRRNNVHTVYNPHELQRLDRGKSWSLPRPSSDQDITGYNLERIKEHMSIFRHLHNLYSASIRVKCKEYGWNDLTLS